MLIDVCYILLLLFAIMKGYSKGFVMAVFSFAALFIGIAAAMKLSIVVAHWLEGSFNEGEKWIPFAAFIIVILAVGIAVRIIAVIIEKSLQLMMLGFINKLAGIILYALLYTILLSVLLFYALQMHLLKPETVATSKFYPFIQPWAPKAINAFGVIIPVFKNMFEELKHFFEQVASKSSVT